MANQDDAPQNPSAGRNEPPHGEDELLAAFRVWDAAGKTPDGKARLPEPPQREEDDATDPQVQWARARRLRWLRQSTLILLVALSSMAIWSGRSELGYLFSSGEPLNLGSPVHDWKVGEPRPELPNNRLVKLSGLVVSSESESGRFNYFYCPIYRIVVRTDRALPEQPLSNRAHIEVDEAFAPLIENKIAFPHDLTAFFEAEGRLLSLKHPPRWARAAIAFYGPLIDGLPSDAWLLIDGDRPKDYLGYGLGLLAALLLTGGAAFLWWRARAREHFWADRVHAFR